MSDEGIFAGYWPLAITLFSMTFGIFIAYSLYTRFKANKAEDHHDHFGGVPHRSIYGLDTSMSARERLDERSDAKSFRRVRTQDALREERAKVETPGSAPEPEGGPRADPLRGQVPVADHSTPGQIGAPAAARVDATKNADIADIPRR